MRGLRNSMEPSDENLIFACRRGEATAWETLIHRYQRLIYTIPRRSGLNEDQAAEVFQRTFMTLVEKLNTIEQPSRIGAWLATTAKRETWRISRRERNIVTLTHTDDETYNEPLSEEVLPDELLLRLEQQNAIRVAIRALDERCQKLLLRLFYEDEPPSYTEIAQEFGMSEGSVGPTRARCLQKMRRLLKDLLF